MPRDRVQHQKGLSDDAFERLYPDEEACRKAGSVRARASKYRLNWDEANRGHAACKMASTVAVLRRWSNLRQSAGTC
jgi:hypothetical protein